MSRLTRDGTAEPVSRDQILRHARRQGNIIFPVQLTTSRIGNLTRLIHTLLYVVTIQWRRPHRWRPRIPVPWGGCGSPRWRSPKTDSSTLRSAGVCVGICKGSFGIIVRYRSVVRREGSKERKSSRARATLEYIRELYRSTPSFLPVILIAHSVISGTYQVPSFYSQRMPTNSLYAI